MRPPVRPCPRSRVVHADPPVRSPARSVYPATAARHDQPSLSSSAGHCAPQKAGSAEGLRTGATMEMHLGTAWDAWEARRVDVVAGTGRAFPEYRLDRCVWCDRGVASAAAGRVAHPWTRPWMSWSAGGVLARRHGALRGHATAHGGGLDRSLRGRPAPVLRGRWRSALAGPTGHEPRHGRALLPGGHLQSRPTRWRR